MRKLFCLFFGFFVFFGAGLSCNASSDSKKYFTDVHQDQLYYSSIESLYELGVVKGYVDKTFLPNNLINRAEFLKIVMGYFNLIGYSHVPVSGTNCFSDVKDQWFAGYVCSAHEKGVVDGYKNGTFQPQANISLAEASKIIYNFRNLSKGLDTKVSNPWYEKYVESLAGKKAIPFTITGFDHLLTRGEMAEIVLDFVVSSAGASTGISLSYDDLVSMSNLSSKANFAYRFQKFYGHTLKENGVPDGVDSSTFKRIMLGTSNCGLNDHGKDECELVESELYRDANRIYNYPPDTYDHKLTVLEGTDAKTFEVHPDIISQYASDKNNFYVTDKENPLYHKTDKTPNKVQLALDKAKFDTVYDSSIGSFLKDKNGFYYALDDFKNPRKIELFHADNFKLIGDFGSVILFADGGNLYMAKQMKSYGYTSDDIIIKKLDYVDLTSLELLTSTFENLTIVGYFKDKSKVYYFGSSEEVPITKGFYYTVSKEFLSEVTGVDVETFEAIQPGGGLATEQYFTDKNGVYLAEGQKMLKIEGADKITFGIVFVFKDFDKFSPAYPEYYLKDKNNIWVLNADGIVEKVVGVSPEGFDYAKYLQDKGVEHWEEKG